MIRLSLTVLLVGLLFSCQLQKETRLTAYYNLDSLVTAQVDLLSTQGLVPFKVAMVNQKQETDTLVADSTTWANELQAFRILDLNKSNLLNAYQTVDSQTGYTYKLKPEEARQGVIELSIRQFSNSKPATITGRFEETNNLYSSQREYELQFDGQGYLQYYKLDGRQRVAFGEWVSYNVEGHVGRRP